MKKPAYFYSLTIVLLASCSSLATATTAEEGAPAEGEQLVEKERPRQEKAGWFERIFGNSSDRGEEQEVKERRTESKEEDDKEKSGKKEAGKAKGFSEEERRVLEEWQRGEAGWKKSGRRLPPGLQKKVDRGGELPPGWKKKLAVGETLPKELEAEAKTLPEEILERLPKTREGTEVIQIGDEVIRVVENTREIIDILGIGQAEAGD